MVYLYQLLTLFLNPLEHAGKRYIRIWHKPNPFISKRLKEASWIRFSKTYKCFVMYHTHHTIEMKHQHFQGLARVDTRYLYRPKRLRPVQGAVNQQQDHRDLHPHHYPCLG